MKTSKYINIYIYEKKIRLFGGSVFCAFTFPWEGKTATGKGKEGGQEKAATPENKKEKTENILKVYYLFDFLSSPQLEKQERTLNVKKKNKQKTQCNFIPNIHLLAAVINKQKGLGQKSHFLQPARMDLKILHAPELLHTNIKAVLNKKKEQEQPEFRALQIPNSPLHGDLEVNLAEPLPGGASCGNPALLGDRGGARPQINPKNRRKSHQGSFLNAHGEGKSHWKLSIDRHSPRVGLSSSQEQG